MTLADNRSFAATGLELQIKLEEAAARIEALEAALREIVAEGSYQGVPIKTPQPPEDMVLIALAALERNSG